MFCLSNFHIYYSGNVSKNSIQAFMCQGPLDVKICPNVTIFYFSYSFVFCRKFRSLIPKVIGKGKFRIITLQVSNVETYLFLYFELQKITIKTGFKELTYGIKLRLYVLQQLELV